MSDRLDVEFSCPECGGNNASGNEQWKRLMRGVGRGPVQ